MFNRFKTMMIFAEKLFATEGFKELLNLDKAEFLTIFHMILEEYCKKYDLDITDIIGTVYEVVKRVEK